MEFEKVRAVIVETLKTVGDIVKYLEAHKA